MLSAGLIRQTVGLGMLAVPLLLGLRASASEAPPPVVTVETAAQHDGQVAAVEVNVVEVKFAQRRKMYFLSGNPNFRSQTNLPVAIRASDFEAFEKAGIADLSAKYLGQRVRASGKVVGDEGQWLLVVAGPADINILSPAPAVDTLRAVTIVDEQGRETRINFPFADDIPRSSISLEHEGAKEEYRGVTVAELLTRAKIQLAPEARGVLLGRYVLIRGRDGYAALFSVAEIDPYYAQQPALLSDDLNGKPIPDPRGPVRLVVPSDKHRRRWVGQVATIEVHNALEKPALEKPTPDKPAPEKPAAP